MRLFDKFYAWLFGYFWVPCPVCGREFGGHECGFGALIGEDGHARIVCNDPQCTHEAAIRNLLNGHTQCVRGNDESN